MELGVFFDHLTEAADQEGLSLERVLAYAHAQGITYVEMSGSYYMNNERRVEEMFKSTGIRVGCVDERLDLAHDKGVEDGERLVRFAREHGVENVLIIPGLIDTGEERAEVMERIAKNLQPLAHVAAGLHVNCLLEDFDNERAPYGTWQELKWFMDRVAGLGVCFDTGNFAFFGQDEQEALEALLPLIKMVHCKDRALHGLPDEQGVQSPSGRLLYPCAVGRGFIGVRRIVEALRGRGYAGQLMIEHYDASRQCEKLAESAAYLRDLV